MSKDSDYFNIPMDDSRGKIKSKQIADQKDKIKKINEEVRQSNTTSLPSNRIPPIDT